MSTETKLKLILVFSLFCLAGLLVQGYLLWQVQSQLVSESTAIPQSIQQRLDANAGLGAPVSSPFGLLNQPLAGDPFSQMQQQLDSMFELFSPPSISSMQGFGIARATPQLTLSETDTEYQVSVETEADTDVEVNTELEANLLTVRGAVTENISSNSSALSSSFVSRSQFTRRFDLPKPVDDLGVFTEATNDGLVIHVPKK